MMSYKVLYVIDKMIRAGTQRQLSRVVTGLDRRGFEPLICCLLYPGDLGEELRRRGIEVISLGLTDIMGFRFARAVGRIAALARSENIDLLHSYLFSANLVTPPAGFLSGRPVVTSRSDSGFWKKPRHVRALRCANIFVRRITANSGPVREYLLRRERVRPARVALVYNGIQAAPLPAPSSGGAPVRLGCLGNIRPVKGYEYLLRALAEVRGEWELSIAGRVLDGEYGRRLERLAAELGLSERVRFLGGVTRAGSFLGGLDLLVLPSLSEGFSNTLLEAMAAGLPVVATSVGSNPEVIREGRDGFLVPPGESSALARCLRDLIADPRLRERLGLSARRRVESDFSITRTVSRMQALYREILEAEPG
jgi:glycosyltransferase involved in cell wall biosynthesis